MPGPYGIRTEFQNFADSRALDSVEAVEPKTGRIPPHGTERKLDGTRAPAAVIGHVDDSGLRESFPFPMPEQAENRTDLAADDQLEPCRSAFLRG